MDANREEASGAPTPRGRARGAARANLAGSLGMVWGSFNAPGSLLLTLFLKEWLHAANWQIGLVMTMTFLGPTFELPGAYLTERYGSRWAWFVFTHLVNRLSFLTFVAIPFLFPNDSYQSLGVLWVLAVVGGTRVIGHLGAPAWWSWMADLVPELCRGRFFACRSQWTSAFQAASLITAMTLLQTCGGMTNRCLVGTLFLVGGLCGVSDILLYFWVPEPPFRTNRLRSPGWRDFLTPFCQPGFRRLILGMGLWSFSANLVLPFVAVYQRGEVLAGQQLGLGISWLFLGVLNVLAGVAATLSSPTWASCSRRMGPFRLLLIGSGHLFIHLVYLLVTPGPGMALLVPVALVTGALTAAWTVSTHQLMLGLAPRENRSFFVSAYNCVNGWLMAGGPLLGGLLAELLPSGAPSRPDGIPWSYFHFLILLAVLGGMAALAILARIPRTEPSMPTLASPPFIQVLQARIRLLTLPFRDRRSESRPDSVEWRGSAKTRS